jgi:hypothetical protein
MTTEQINEIISTVKVGQIWKDSRPPKFQNASGLMEIMAITEVPDYRGRNFIQSIRVAYARDPFKMYRQAPKEYAFGCRKFAELFTLHQPEPEKQSEIIALEEKVEFDRFDNIID